MIPSAQPGRPSRGVRSIACTRSYDTPSSSPGGARTDVLRHRSHLGRLPRQRAAARVRRRARAVARSRPEDAARRRRRRRLELRRRAAQAQLRHRGDGRARAGRQEAVGAARSTRSCPATTTVPRTSPTWRSDGVDVSVVYPNNAIFIYIEPDRELALACMRSYNDWVLDEFQGAAPEHIVGLPMLPVDDGIDVCIAELDRCLAKGRTRRVHPRASRSGRTTTRTTTRCTRTSPTPGVPLTLPPHVRRQAVGGRLRRAGRAEDHRRPGTVYRFFAAVRPFTYMVMGGVFDRHPGPAHRRRRGELRLAAVLGADDGAEPRHPRRARRRHRRRPQLSPTELLGRNLFVTVLDDHVGLPAHARLPVARRRVDVLDRLSAQRHAVAELARAHRRRSPPTSPTRRRGKVLAGNAERVVRCLRRVARAARSRSATAGPSSPSPT